MAAASSGTPAHPAAAASSGTPAHPATHRRRKVAGAVTGALAGGAAVAVAAAVALGGFSSSDASARGNTRADLAVTGGYIPRPILADLAAAYVTVTNSGGTPAELTSVTTPLAAHVTLHTTTGTTMRQVASLTVPAGGRLTLGTGGDHLMLENLTRRPAVGDTVPLTLHFAHATPAAVTVTVPVRPTTYRPGD
ncbi:copper chaperone PCu(A)C [Streptomyces sp.]|uniref:copper chaperone PCu(A)C n=1 Tax=Streptomyces sp. TaxID=1931 RepID=UPI002F3E8882